MGFVPGAPLVGPNFFFLDRSDHSLHVGVVVRCVVAGVLAGDSTSAEELDELLRAWLRFAHLKAIQRPVYNGPMPVTTHALTAAFVVALACVSSGCRKRAATPSPPSATETRDAGGSTAVARPDDPAPIAQPQHTAPDPPTPAPAPDSREVFLASLTDQAKAAFLVGEAALAEDDYDTAVREISRAVELQPDNIRLFRALADTRVAAGQPALAAEMYEHILQLTPGDRPVMYDLAVTYTRLHRYRDAQRTYRELLDLDETNLAALFNLATVYRAQGKLEAARQTWQAYLRHDKANAEVYALLGELFLQLDRPGEALGNLREAHVLNPDDLKTLRHMAAAAKLSENFGWAAIALNRAVGLSPDDAGLWADLGDVLLTIYRTGGDGDHLAKAVVAWQTSLELLPDQPALQEYLATYSQGTPDGN